VAKPKITLSPEPKQGQVITFQLLAPERKDKLPVGQFSVLLRIRNGEASPLVLTQVGFEVFPTPSGQPQVMNNPVLIHIPPGGTGLWHNKVFTAESKHTGLPADTPINQNMLVPPGANIVNISLKFRDFDEPVKKLYALRLHQSPTPKGAYQFPAKKADLRENECWNGSGANHGQSHDGCQLFGLDLGVSGWDKSSKSWSHLLPGGVQSRNEDHRIWRKPVYAMADGVVRGRRWDFPGNAAPSDTLTDEINALMESVGDGNGNFVTIRTDTELHLYAHLIEGSIPQRIRTVGAAVKKGDLLGLAGNSGNSSAPHLHIDVRSSRLLALAQDGQPIKMLHILRPMPFVDMHSIHSREMRGGFKPDAPWFKHSSGHGLCLAAWPERCLIWPSRSLSD
jgi:hypothetical protein